MNPRQWAYTTLTQDTALGEMVPADRIFASQAMMTAQVARPLIVLKFGNDSDEQLFDDPDIPLRPSREFFEVWIHDDRPSYMQIDGIIDLVKQALRTQQTSPDAHIIAVKLMDVSADLEDTSMDTVLRYIRFHLVKSQ